MEANEDFALGDVNAENCRYCVNDDGSVKSCDEIFEGGVDFFMSTFANNQNMAERLCRKNMLGLPFWQGKDCDCLKGEMATEEEYADFMKKME